MTNNIPFSNPSKGHHVSDSSNGKSDIRSLLVMKNNLKKQKTTSLKQTIHSNLILRCMVLMG